MTSYFSWLDYSEHQRQRMLDAIDMFREQTTRDELGIGVVRDAFADLFFPGTSTIQTRARYFLFVPWIYMGLEARQVSSSKIAGRARQAEVALIHALLDSGETNGVIGSRAKAALKRLPSNIYWQGLAAWGIRLFYGAQSQYHRALDRYYDARQRSKTLARECEGVSASRYTWDPGLPAPPEQFPKDATFELTCEEARYLREQITRTHDGSLLAHLVNRDEPVGMDSDFPWSLSFLSDLPDHLREQLTHARHFSEVIFGASLLYNLMLAEKARHDDLCNHYRNALRNWSNHLDKRQKHLTQWNRERFWEIVTRDTTARIYYPTRDFINCWLDLALDDPNPLVDSGQARDLVCDRESVLKREHARLLSPRALELWSGAAGAMQLDFRWRTAKQIIDDILQGLLGEARAGSTRSELTA